MSPQELIAHCQKQIDMCGQDAETVSILPGKWGKTDHKTVLGVKGEKVQEMDNGVAVIFPAEELMRAVEKKLQEGEDLDGKTDNMCRF